MSTGGLSGFMNFWRRSPESLTQRRRLTCNRAAGPAGASTLASTLAAQQTVDLPNNTVRTSRYTAITFVPMNLWEQLQRPLNLYFVVISTLLCIPAIAPVSPATIIIPLAIAFAIAGAKEAVDDYKRHKGDDAVNSAAVRTLDVETASLVFVRSDALRPGDIVVLFDGEAVPCDIVPLSSDDTWGGSAYCSTANLDGETEAKKKNCVFARAVSAAFPDDDTTGLLRVDVATVIATQIFTDRSLMADRAPKFLEFLELTSEHAKRLVVDCEAPSQILASFAGEAIQFEKDLRNIRTDESPGLVTRTPLHIDDMMVSTSVVANGSVMTGVVVYTGNESKIHRCRKEAPLKWSVMDALTNRFAVSIFALQLTCVVIMTVLNFVNEHRHHSSWYLAIGVDMAKLHDIFIPLRYFLLMSIMVPLSVKVTLEVSKFYISQVIEWDLDLYDEETDFPARVNSRALAEELGLVQFVMADKTGTLTENRMKLSRIAFASPKTGVRDIAAYAKAKDIIATLSAADTSMGTTYGGTASSSPVAGDRRVMTRHDIADLCRDPDAILMFHAILCNSSCERTTDAVLRTVPIAGGASSSRFSTPRTDAEQFVYHGSSPDEIALMSALANELGVVMAQRNRHTIEIESSSSAALNVAFDVLGTAPFTSERGMMSVLVQRRATGFGSTLIVKGADERIGAIRDPNPVHVPSWEFVSQSVENFSKEGLRTLVYGRRELDALETAEWMRKYAESQLLEDPKARASVAAALWREIERDIIVLGATAVEDQLQAGVPDAIAALRCAGIRVWMLTGDKHHTAVQTGRLSGLLTPSDTSFSFDVDPNDDEFEQRRKLSVEVRRTAFALREAAAANGSRVAPPSMLTPVGETTDAELRAALLSPTGVQNADSSTPKGLSRAQQLDTANPTDRDGIRDAIPYVTVITGRALRALASNEALLAEFDPILAHSATVICCRVTPDQKAFVVSLMRRRGAMCLSIGDGGNDVPMIQEADIGVGIAGVEGRQAAQAADYAVARFRFLVPLLLTHGHTAVMRSAYLVQYIFYKSLIIGFIQLLYNGVFAMSSGVSYFDSVALTSYNSVFTLALACLPVLDTHLPKATLRSDPSLYRLSQSGSYMNRGTFQLFVLRAAVHAVIVLMVASYVFDGDFVGHNGRPFATLDGAYVGAFVPLILVQCFIVTIEFHSITVLHAVLIPLSFVSFFILYAVYSATLVRAPFYGLFGDWAGQLPLWVATPVVTAAVVIPFAFVAAVRFHVAPSKLQQWRRKLFMNRTWESLVKARRDDRATAGGERGGLTRSRSSSVRRPLHH